MAKDLRFLGRWIIAMVAIAMIFPGQPVRSVAAWFFLCLCTPFQDWIDR